MSDAPSESIRPWRYYAAEYTGTENLLEPSPISNALARQALASNLVFQQIHFYDNLLPEKGQKLPPEEQKKVCLHRAKSLKNFFNKHGGIVIQQRVGPNGFEYLWAWDRTAVILFAGKDRMFRFKLFSTDPAQFKKFARYVESYRQKLIRVVKPAPTPETSNIHVLLPTREGVTFTDVGNNARPFNGYNYSEEVNTAYRAALEDLKSAAPRGRLVLLNGPTGTGKTYLVRALMHDFPSAKYLVVPAEATAELLRPELLASLIKAQEYDDEYDDEQEEESDVPTPPTKRRTRTMVLILEDADEALSTRNSNNVSAISSLLNLSDGLIGSLLDLRIVCTTNVEAEHIDKALLRPGRLSARIDVRRLTPMEAGQAYLANGGKNADRVWDNHPTLAEVYETLGKEKEVKAE